MLITILDDGNKYDGSSFETQPLGGSQKAIIKLAESFTTIGHVVRVFNNCEESIVINGVSWKSIKNMDAAHSDVWIANNNPLLFNLISNNSKKILWLTSSGLKLVLPDYFSVTMQNCPTIIYQGENHLDSIPDAVKSLNAALISPGVSEEFLLEREITPSITPVALFTSHPLMGLDWVLDIWKSKIHTKIPWAELHIFSNILVNFFSGKKMSDRYKDLVEKILDHDKFNIKIRKPLIDKEMVEEIKGMRVHLYPSNKNEAGAYTLAESQAVGIPAVVRNLGVAPNRIINGKTGFVCNNKEEFAEYSIRFLEDNTSFTEASEESKKNYRRSWNKVANEFLKVISGI